MRTLAFLDEISLRDATTFGKEAAALGDLTKAGLPVAYAFVLPVSAYGEFLSGKQIKGILALGDPDRPEEFRRLLLTVPLPSRLEREVREFYRSLSGPQDVLVSVRTRHGTQQVGNIEDLLLAIRRAWVEHLVDILQRGGNFYKEPLPALVQQETVAHLSGNLFTSASELASPDFCLVEVIHPAGKERIVLEKGTGEIVKRIVAGLIENPTESGGIIPLSSWAQKIERILGGTHTLGWRYFRGEFVFDWIRRVFLPALRETTLELWLAAEGELPSSLEGTTGLIARKVDEAIKLAKRFPQQDILLLLDSSGEFSQLNRFRTGRHKLELRNLHLVLPPVRTVDGLKEIKRYLSGEKIRRGPHLKFFFRAFYPSNIILLSQFLEAGVDGVIFDEEALARGFLGTHEVVEPDESLLWAIQDAHRKCRAEGLSILYFGREARDWILSELVRLGVDGVIVPQPHREEYIRVLQEAEGRRLVAG